MIASIVGYNADGTVTHFHLRFSALTAVLQAALEKCRETGKISKGLLDELLTHKGYFHSIIEDEFELDVI